MKLSSKAHYGLNACCVLAGMYPEKASARELEEALGVSGKYLEQMMRLLASRGIVRAQRGAAGGGEGGGGGGRADIRWRGSPPPFRWERSSARWKTTWSLSTARRRRAPAKNACPQPSGRSSTGRSTGCWTK